MVYSEVEISGTSAASCSCQALVAQRRVQRLPQLGCGQVDILFAGSMQSPHADQLALNAAADPRKNQKTLVS